MFMYASISVKIVGPFEPGLQGSTFQDLERLYHTLFEQIWFELFHKVSQEAQIAMFDSRLNTAMRFL
jgi:hypothetical protein